MSNNDPFETFKYGFKHPDTGHWQSGTIDRSVKYEPMQDFSKLSLQNSPDKWHYVKYA
jgi:hypothetical protein